MKKISVTITISALSKWDIHKLTITPSVAVNPPAIQYFTGVQRNLYSNTLIDNRFLQMKSDVITMLSSDEYPNPPICLKRKATIIANKVLPKLLKKIKNENITVTEVYNG